MLKMKTPNESNQKHSRKPHWQANQAQGDKDTRSGRRESQIPTRANPAGPLHLRTTGLSKKPNRHIRRAEEAVINTKA